MDQKQESSGPLTGIVIIVIVLVLGGLYYAGKGAPENTMTAEDVMNQPDESLESLRTQSASDEIDAIEADLEGTDFDSLDQELEAIDAELGEF